MKLLAVAPADLRDIYCMALEGAERLRKTLELKPAHFKDPATLYLQREFARLEALRDRANVLDGAPGGVQGELAL
jgi:hypothetical protein